MSRRRARKGDELTARQAQVLDYVVAHVELLGYPPTRREVAAALGLTDCVQAIAGHFEALAAKGYLETETKAARALRVVRLSCGEEVRLRYVTQERGAE